MRTDRDPSQRAFARKERPVLESRARGARRRTRSPWPVVVATLAFASLALAGGWYAFRRAPDVSRAPNAPKETAGTATPSATSSAESAAPSVATEFSPEPPAESASNEEPREPAPTGPLARFFVLAEQLKHGKRHEPVRVLWLGDSHTFADFWPDAVRRPLSDRFGAGGPGFLFTGVNAYRHAGARFSRGGEWEVSPDRPALAEHQADGVFGLGGMRSAATSPDSSMTITVDRAGLRGDATWDLCFRLPTAASGFRVQGDGMRPLLVDAGTYQPGRLQHVTWRTPAPATVTIDGTEGAPEFCGVVVEGSTPGIVVDSVGIIGARVATPLSWEAPQWISEAKRRHPAVAVLAYGTNECGDGVPVSVYAGQYARMLERVRAASPDVECVIVGPTDRVVKLGSPGRVKQITVVQQQAAASLGCAFFSTQEAMGGEGGFTKWASVDGAFTSGDGVHLAPNGYAELGAQMVRLLLSERPGLQ